MYKNRNLGTYAVYLGSGEKYTLYFNILQIHSHSLSTPFIIRTADILLVVSKQIFIEPLCANY